MQLGSSKRYEEKNFYPSNPIEIEIEIEFHIHHAFLPARADVTRVTYACALFHPAAAAAMTVLPSRLVPL